MTTLFDVNCDHARELVSAAADGEVAEADRTRVAEHLHGCRPCSDYAAAVDTIDRMIRVRPAEPVPDLVGSVTAAAAPARLGRGGWMRPALVWVAFLLAAQSVPALVFGNANGAEEHLARHLGAFGFALAIGFGFVAWRPHRAAGLLPLVGALVIAMLASTLFDVIDGGRSAVSEATHLTELIGLALIWMIAGSPGRPHAVRSPRIVRPASGDPGV